MSLIPRFYPQTEGRILLDGIDVHDLQLADLHANIGVVSQNVILFNDTIAVNVAHGQPDIDEQAIRQAAKAADALEFIDTPPQGLGTDIGENGVSLSGGQRQRISIARALLKNSPILLLDETTSALDTGSKRAVQEALENARCGRTTIVNADRIVVMQQVRITEVGTHEELLAKQGAYSQLHAMQFAH